LESGTVKSPGHPGLFVVQLNGRTAAHTADEVDPAFAHPLLVRVRAEPSRRQARKSALRRYCSGCSRETEQIPRPGGGRPNIPSIQSAAAEPASGATVCLDCGQLRAAASRPSPPAWSSWPRKPREITAARNRAPTQAESALAFDDEASEAAAENEGMSAEPERPSTRVLPRPHPAAAVATRLERRSPDRHRRGFVSTTRRA
jgi:hypothetical protein